MNETSRKTAAVTALAVAVALALAGCRTGSSPVHSASSHPGRDDGPDGGVPAATLACDRFPTEQVQQATRRQVTSALVRTTPVSPDAAASGGLTCAYTVYTPGTDLDSADRGMVQVTLTVNDVWEDTPITGHDDDKHQQKAFESTRDNARTVANGQSDNEAKTTYHDVSGIGAGAYLEDTVHTQDGGTLSQYTVDVSMLHTPRPYRLEVVVSYVIPQPDQPLPDTSLDKVRDEAGRATLSQAITAALCDKVG